MALVSSGNESEGEFLVAVNRSQIHSFIGTFTLHVISYGTLELVQHQNTFYLFEKKTERKELNK